MREDPEQTYRDFHEAVNMPPAALEHWLASEESRSVGITHDGDSESVGHHSGTRIVGILRTRKAELSDADFAHMAKVVGYVRRHLAQGPEHKSDIPASRWRYSLMNWGHDPLKD